MDVAIQKLCWFGRSISLERQIFNIRK
jgi:hypothetical protein